MQEAEDREELESFSAAVHALRSRLQVSNRRSTCTTYKVKRGYLTFLKIQLSVFSMSLQTVHG